MKNAIIILSWLFIGSQIHAQNGFGLYFGVNQNLSSENTILLGDGNQYEYAFSSKGHDTGYSLGLFHGTDIAGVFYLNKSVQVTKETQSFQLSNLTDAPYEESRVNRYNIQVPITAGVRIGALSIGVGPTLNINASESRSSELDQTFRINQERVSWSGILEASYSLNRTIAINARLNQSFSGASNGYYYNNQPVKIEGRPTQWSLGAIITPF